MAHLIRPGLCIHSCSSFYLFSLYMLVLPSSTSESFFHVLVENGQKELKIILILWFIVLEQEREAFSWCSYIRGNAAWPELGYVISLELDTSK